MKKRCRLSAGERGRGHARPGWRLGLAGLALGAGLWLVLPSVPRSRPSVSSGPEPAPQALATNAAKWKPHVPRDQFQADLRTLMHMLRYVLEPEAPAPKPPPAATV